MTLNAKFSKSVIYVKNFAGYLCNKTYTCAKDQDNYKLISGNNSVKVTLLPIPNR